MAAAAAAPHGAGMTRSQHLVCASVLAGLAACGSTTDLPFDDQGSLLTLLPQLTVGATTRADMLLALGMPVERFEGDRILCWRIAPTATGATVPVSRFVSPWYGAPATFGFTSWVPDPRVRIEPAAVATLVLSFDDHGVLRRAKLLRQRES